MSDYSNKNEKVSLEDIQDQREKEANAQFRKSVLAVAEAFFAMSKEEREAMVDYVKNKDDEWEE